MGGSLLVKPGEPVFTRVEQGDSSHDETCFQTPSAGERHPR